MPLPSRGTRTWENNQGCCDWGWLSSWVMSLTRYLSHFPIQPIQLSLKWSTPTYFTWDWWEDTICCISPETMLTVHYLLHHTWDWWQDTIGYITPETGDRTLFATSHLRLVTWYYRLHHTWDWWHDTISYITPETGDRTLSATSHLRLW